jgi:hypothetical protein
MVLQFVVGCECSLNAFHRTHEAEDLILNHSRDSPMFLGIAVTWIKRDFSIKSLRS